LLHFSLTRLEVDLLLLTIQPHLLLEFLPLSLFLLHELLVVIFLERQFLLLKVGVPVRDRLFPLKPVLCLPGRVVDLTVHEPLVLHFVHNCIYLLGIAERVDHPLMLTDVFVNEIQTFCDDFQLVYDLLELERHQF
jgi:hypothetical protein